MKKKRFVYRKVRKREKKPTIVLNTKGKCKSIFKNLNQGGMNK